jgi:hypothetical protein
MWSNQVSAINAAKKSSHVKDNGSFIIVYYPHRRQYTYYVSESWAKHDGTWEPFEVVARFVKKGWFRPWVALNAGQTDLKLNSQDS